MENKELQTALSQIKRPVRYDENYNSIYDADGTLIIGELYNSFWNKQGLNTFHAFGHYLAECINGMGDGVKLQDEANRLITMLQSGIESQKNYGNGMDEASWGYEEGVLLTGNNAQAIVDLLSQFPPESSANASTDDETEMEARFAELIQDEGKLNLFIEKYAPALKIWQACRPSNTTIRRGDKMLRRKTGDNEQWVEFTVNSTYLPLIKEFPEDYRYLDGSPIKAKESSANAMQGDGELSQKLKLILAATWRKMGDKKALASSDGAWTGNELADEIEKETERGVKMIEMILNLAIDLVQRDKSFEQAPAREVRSAEEFCKEYPSEAKHFLKGVNDPLLWKMMTEYANQFK